MTSIYLIRHATHDRLGRVLCGRMADVGLSEEGLRQAEALARCIEGEPKVTALYSSPLERTLQTAEPIARSLGLAPRITEALNEVDVGRWTGASFAALRGDPAWRSWKRAPVKSRPPGGESLADVAARVGGWIDEMRRAHPDETIVAVSHGDVIKTAIALALGLGLDRLHRFEISPASLSLLLVGGRDQKVCWLNRPGASTDP
ncbi:MAG TPA: histidine phosphatase family protein [Caulobacteraceae bacterium]|nr:histidine phosphatase family protein [Caulobacteraceae bacterium]